MSASRRRKKAATPKNPIEPASVASFAEFVLERMPELAKRLRGGAFAKWLASQESLDVDGGKRWLIWGDRLADEAEMKVNWAREHGLIDEAKVQELQANYSSDDPDVEAIDVN